MITFDAPELKVPWDTVIEYDVEVQGHWNPPVSWIVRKVRLHDFVTLKTRLYGPFTGAIGGAAARSVANSLNHYTRTFECWPTLLPEEREYIMERKDREAIAGIDDDEIPF